jgi:hypothetical protein
MARNDSFEVLVSGGSTSVDEYLRAMAAPKSQLPELTEQQKLVTKKLGLSEEEYRRGVLADQIGKSRIVERGKKLGVILQELLGGLGKEYHVEAMKAEMTNFRWLARITYPDGELVVEIPRDLADDVLDAGRSEQMERLKAFVLRSLKPESHTTKS